MSRSRTKSSVMILSFSIIQQISLIVARFASRTLFIYILGNEYLGLNGLFTNVLSFLTLSEMGISTAISFWLYKPLAERDEKRINTIVKFYAQCYRVVGASIIALGLFLVPFLDRIVNFEQDLPINLYLVFILFLFNSAASYLLFAYKQNIFTADQKQDTVERVNICFNVIGVALDAVVLVIFKAFIPYLISKIILTLFKNLVFSVLADKQYPFINDKVATKLTKNEKKTFFKGLYSLSVFGIGSILMKNINVIIISVMLGTVFVGYFSNYTLIVTSVFSLFGLVSKAISASIGNIFATENKKRIFDLYKEFSFSAFAIFLPLSIGLIFALNPFMEVWIGGVDANYIMTFSVPTILAFGLYTGVLIQVLNAFKEASGVFNAAAHSQIIGGVVCVPLSVVLGKFFGINGILLATFLCGMFISAMPLCYSVGRKVFSKSGWLFVWIYIKQMLFTAGVFVVTYFVCCMLPNHGIKGFIVQSVSSVLISASLLWVFFHQTKEYKMLIKRLFRGKVAIAAHEK